jgi:hypothetical protein
LSIAYDLIDICVAGLTFVGGELFVRFTIRSYPHVQINDDGFTYQEFGYKPRVEIAWTTLRFYSEYKHFFLFCYGESVIHFKKTLPQAEGLLELAKANGVPQLNGDVLSISDSKDFEDILSKRGSWNKATDWLVSKLKISKSAAHSIIVAQMSDKVKFDPGMER